MDENKYLVLGVRYYNFTDEKSGRLIKGYSMWVGQNLINTNEAGMITTKVSVPEDIFKNIGLSMNDLIKKEVFIYFNQKGNTQAVILC